MSPWMKSSATNDRNLNPLIGLSPGRHDQYTPPDALVKLTAWP
ncbi:MAG: hypothetical protein ACLS43_11590 [Evtepia gabavorous]